MQLIKSEKRVVKNVFCTYVWKFSSLPFVSGVVLQYDCCPVVKRYWEMDMVWGSGFTGWTAGTYESNSVSCCLL